MVNNSATIELANCENTMIENQREIIKVTLAKNNRVRLQFKSTIHFNQNKLDGTLSTKHHCKLWNGHEGCTTCYLSEH